MPYVTLTELTDRFGAAQLVALTDRAEVPTGLIDTAVTDRAIAEADAVIESYIAGRYALPLSVAQPVLTDIAGAIVFWKLHTFAPDPKVEADYKEALRQLERISAGTMKLNAAGIEAGGTGGTGVRVADRERPFTAETMKGFI